MKWHRQVSNWWILRLLVWLRGFTYFAEGKATCNLQNVSSWLWSARNFWESDNRSSSWRPRGWWCLSGNHLNIECLFHSTRKCYVWKTSLCQLCGEPREDVDSFLLWCCKHCGYRPAELEFAMKNCWRNSLPTKLQTKLFEGPIIQLAAAIDKTRALEMAWHQASNIAKGEEGQSNVNMVKDRGSKKPSSGFGQLKSRICQWRWGFCIVYQFQQGDTQPQACFLTLVPSLLCLVKSSLTTS